MNRADLVLFRSAEGAAPGGESPLVELHPVAARLASHTQADSWSTFAGDAAHCQERGDGQIGAEIDGRGATGSRRRPKTKRPIRDPPAGSLPDARVTR